MEVCGLPSWLVMNWQKLWVDNLSHTKQKSKCFLFWWSFMQYNGKGVWLSCFYRINRPWNKYMWCTIILKQIQTNSILLNKCWSVKLEPFLTEEHPVTLFDVLFLLQWEIIHWYLRTVIRSLFKRYQLMGGFLV